jgi:hypothetical protein
MIQYVASAIAAAALTLGSWAGCATQKPSPSNTGPLIAVSNNRIQNVSTVTYRDTKVGQRTVTVTFGTYEDCRYLLAKYPYAGPWYKPGDCFLTKQ